MKREWPSYRPDIETTAAGSLDETGQSSVSSSASEPGKAFERFPADVHRTCGLVGIYVGPIQTLFAGQLIYVLSQIIDLAIYERSVITDLL